MTGKTLVVDPLLVITATPEEGAPFREAWSSESGVASGSVGSTTVHLRALGVGKVNTASGLDRAIAELAPAAIVQLGIGGTYAGSFLPVGGVAVAEVEYDLDFGVVYAEGWEGSEALGFGLLPDTLAVGENRLPTDAELGRWLSLGDRVPRVAFGTSDAVSGDLTIAAARRARFDLAVESMEGAAAAQVAAKAGIPFAEIRGISNVAGQRDKRHWEIRAAIRAATKVLLAALQETR